METIFSSSGRYNTNSMDTTEFPENDKGFWEKCVWNVKNRPLVFLLILLLVVSVIGALIYFTTDIFNKPQALKFDPLEFQRLLSADYEPNLFNGTWVQGDEILMKDDKGDIVLFNVKNLSTTFLANATTKNVANAFQYDLSADKQYLLLAYRYKKVYRHSFTAFYDIINVKTGEQFTLTDENSGNPWDLQLVKWSPIGHSLAIVDHNNIYYIQDVNNLTSTVQLTFTGGSELYNGIPDWVYEEEIFSSNSATWFSKLGTRVAYASFNDSSVPIMQIPVYGFPGNLAYQYPSIVSIHYPKVGVPNPKVELFVQRLDVIGEKPPPILVEPPKELTSVTKNIILNTVVWSDDTNLFAMWMNRIQNKSYLVHYSVVNSAETIQVVTFGQPGGWLDFTQIPLVGDEHRLAIIYPVRQRNGDDFKHLVVVEPDGKLTAVTNGKFEVLELLKWDVRSNYIYYLANTEENPEEQYLYRVLVKEQSSPECMSCKTECKNHKAEMSAEIDYYALTCSGPNVPEVKIFKTTGEKALDWETNDNLKDLISPITLPRVSFIDVPIGNEFKARVRLILPPAVDESSDVKYPLLINTYAGPGSNLAINKFSLEWNMFFSSSKNVIVAQIDGRGSGRRGNRNTFANYLKLGTYEIEDQIAVTSYLQERFSFIDKSKTAIWGWSYGGYTAAMALTKDDKNVFKCGLSVAPVTDWIYYDSIYTERYMGLLQDDTSGYKNASLLTHAEKLRGKKYMVIHGTYDDNVHYQQSMMLSYELERRVILFRQQTYPDESHGLLSVRNHVYQTIGSYLLDCFHDRL
ncbi:venom dipeptidyl peptidase 4 isoform X2 [Myzus persicae]|uniref:venom dipeptidyl peptidase 4 isoform X2 n=1 Tax=Myzus persicae TaxID=13164 RepID=UPI000B933EC1|nr:venom dipeptidyl peptidase 4 isoform X2 [Myzus persicae]